MKRSQGENATSIEPPPEWFQWEFLRRNEQYQRDYRQFDRQFRAWFKEHGYWWAKTGPAYSSDDLFFLWSVVRPVASVICKRWGISDPYDPDWTFDQSGMRLEQGTWVGLPVFGVDASELAIWNVEEPDPAVIPSIEERVNELLRDIPETIEVEPWRVTHDERLIRFEINITQPIESTLREVKRRIDLARRRYEARFNSIPDHRRKPRTRLDRYQDYLRVWTLRAENGLTFEQIARSVFPEEMQNADQFSPTVKRVRIQFDRACDLISGEYRQIKS